LFDRSSFRDQLVDPCVIEAPVEEDGPALEQVKLRHHARAGDHVGEGVGLAFCVEARLFSADLDMRNSLTTHRPSTSGGRGWIMSRTPSAWTAARSELLVAEHALISLLALNGLRVSEATGADTEAIGLERGHRTLTITITGGKVVTIPPAPRTARAIDLAIGERCEGPIFLNGEGHRLERHGAGRIVRRAARRAGISKLVGPHTLRHAFITAALDAGVPLRDVQEAASHADPRTTMRYDRARASLDRHATYIVAAFIAGAAR
jgi:integrase